MTLPVTYAQITSRDSDKVCSTLSRDRCGTNATTQARVRRPSISRYTVTNKPRTISVSASAVDRAAPSRYGCTVSRTSRLFASG
jgi:hypothetical protein